MPLFMETYRLSETFNAVINDKKVILDQKLFACVFIAIGVDVIILTIFTRP